MNAALDVLPLGAPLDVEEGIVVDGDKETVVAVQDGISREARDR